MQPNDGNFLYIASLFAASVQAEGNFNLIRIWGGTLFEPRAFYDACDEFGVLIYHDLQYNRDEGDLGNTTDQQAEIAHQMKRLSCVSSDLVCGSCDVDVADRSVDLICRRHHPSIAVWNGGNEMYAPLQPDLDVIVTQIIRHDKSRPVWPASPGSGWLSGVDPLSSRPCGAPDPGREGGGGVLCREARIDGSESSFPSLRAIPNMNANLPPGLPFARPAGPPFPLEYHGPYYEDSTAPTNVMPSSLPAREVDDGNAGPGATPVFTGPDFPGSFIAEFGCTVWQSFESMAGTLSPDQWGMSTPATGGHRCHPGGASMFGLVGRDISDAGELAFKRQTYVSLIGQMLVMKAHIESLRSQNIFGMSVDRSANCNKYEIFELSIDAVVSVDCRD